MQDVPKWTERISLESFFSKKPLSLLELLITISLIGITAAMAVGGLELARQKAIQHEAGYDQQFAKLSETERNLKDLTEFVRNEKSRLRESESLVKDLESKHEQLKPLMEADQKVVNAIIALQKQRAWRDIWSDRVIGFIIGVLSSIIGTLIHAKLFMRRGQPKKG